MKALFIPATVLAAVLMVSSGCEPRPVGDDPAVPDKGVTPEREHEPTPPPTPPPTEPTEPIEPTPPPNDFDEPPPLDTTPPPDETAPGGDPILNGTQERDNAF